MHASFRSCLRLLPILAMLLAAREALAVDHDILWKRISGQCLPNYQARESYSPCAFVDTAHGYVLYKVDRDPYQYLLLPSERITPASRIPAWPRPARPTTSGMPGRRARCWPRSSASRCARPTSR